MQLTYLVTFEMAIPTPEEFLNKMITQTGLSIKVEYLKHGTLLVHDPLNDDNNFSVTWKEGVVRLGTLDYRMQYLMEAAIATLIVLGGKSNYNVQDDAYKKWSDVKDTYKVIPIVDWDGTWPEEKIP